MEDFKGKKALVTGAGSGIGRAIALRLAELGAEVFALSKTEAHLEGLKAENKDIKAVCVDLNNWDETRTAVNKVLPIHLLVNNAGINILKSVLEASPQEFDSVFNVNVKSIMNTTQVVSADLIKRGLRGNIVNISSAAGSVAIKDHLIYCASKAALNMMTKTFALELGPHGIRVNAVSPTAVMTEMGKMAWSDPAKAGPLLARIPQGRFIEIEEVVNPVVYLLSEKSEMINGHDLHVEGGLLTQ